VDVLKVNYFFFAQTEQFCRLEAAFPVTSATNARKWLLQLLLVASVTWVYRVVPFNKLMMPLEENRKLNHGRVEGQ
jgi:hypothetical protein